MKYVLKHPLINGEYNYENNKNCTKIYGVSFGIEEKVGLLIFQNISFFMKSDLSSIQIMQSLFSGTIKDCEILFISDKLEAKLEIKDAFFCHFEEEACCETGVYNFVKINGTSINYINVKWGIYNEFK